MTEDVQVEMVVEQHSQSVEDKTLIERVRSGDKAAFGILVERTMRRRLPDGSRSCGLAR